MISLTGTLGSSTIKQISSFQNGKKKFELISIHVIKDKSENHISNIVNNDASKKDDRENCIKKIVAE